MSADDFTVTPWNVSGKIDYEKLTKRFGTEKMTHAMLDKMRTAAGEDHFMLRRGVFFSHRDLGEVLDAYGRGEKFFMYTGRGPSGHTHIGHLLPWVDATFLQNGCRISCGLMLKCIFRLPMMKNFTQNRNLETYRGDPSEDQILLPSWVGKSEKKTPRCFGTA